jgi:nucleoside-diphosphate-sugar epimerase
VICRLGTIFGVSPGMRFHTAVNKFIWQACQQIPLTVWETALRQQRPYLDLTDAVRAICFILRQKRFDRQIYNVLTQNATVGEIIEYIRPHVPSLRINYVESPIMNQLSYGVANDKFRSLGFKFKGDLRGGILETISLLRTSPARELNEVLFNM